MTKEQYEGTPELIFYCEYNPHDFEDRLEIPFTNEYKIGLNFSRDADNQICINVDLQPKESNVPKGFFGQNILNVTAIAGKNGVGKTNILKKLYRKRARAFDSFIAIYQDVTQIFFVQICPIIQRYTNSNLKIVLNNQQKKIIFLSELGADVKIKSIQGFAGVQVDEWDRGIDSDLVPIKSCKIKMALSSTYRLLCNRQFRQAFELTSHKKSLNIATMGSELYLQLNTTNYSLVFLNFLLDVFTYKLAQEYRNAEDAPRSEKPRKKEKGRFDLTFKEDFHSGTESFNENGYLEEYLKLLKELESMTDKRIDDGELNKYFLECLDFLIANMKRYEKFISSSKYRVFEWELSRLRTIAPKILELDFSEKEILLISPHQFQLFLSDSFSDSFFQLLVLTESLDIKFFGLNIELGQYSSGENSILQNMASIYRFIIDNQKDNDNFILYLDEYEQHLHPEWSRKYLSYLLKFLDIEGERLGIKFQVVLTTHSPYLISELPKENIILLEKNEETGKRTARKSNYGFASNYYDIMSDNFFLDDTIGEFAKQKINECIRKMNTITYLLKKIKDKNLVISKLLNKKIPIRIKGIEKIISIVGDPYIKKPLEGMLLALIDQLNSLKPKQKSLDEILRERQIALQSSGAKND